MPSPVSPAEPSPPQAGAPAPRGSSLLAFAWLAVVFGLASVTRADADIWGHLRFGLDTLRDRALTSVDPYSFTQDKAWVNHEWLSELMMALAYRAGGVAGLIVLKATMLTAVVAIVWSGLRGASHVARIWIIVGLAFGTIHMTASIRPQVWTILAVSLLCRTLVRDRARERRWLPLLFAIWVNCHGGWIVGLGILGVWAAADTYVRRVRLVEWALIICASIAGTLVNPYGWGLWFFIAETVRLTREITEWGPLWGTPALNWIPWIVSTIGTAWFARRPLPMRWPTAAVLVMLSYSSLRVMRIESIFVTATAILLAPAIRERWPAKVTPLVSIVAHYSRAIALVLLALVMSAGFRTHFRSLTCIGVWSATRPDQLALPSLVAAEPGRIVTFFDWGQYALWHLAPRLRVSMDGRRETVYSDDRLDEHAAILAGADDGLKQLSAWRAEYVWLPISSTKTAAWLRANGYRIDLETERSFIAVRSDLPRLPRAAPGAMEPSCFPG
jgi:hypothetical protein